MSRKPKSPAAQLAALRWAKTTAKERSEFASRIGSSAADHALSRPGAVAGP